MHTYSHLQIGTKYIFFTNKETSQDTMSEISMVSLILECVIVLLFGRKTVRKDLQIIFIYLYIYIYIYIYIHIYIHIYIYIYARQMGKNQHWNILSNNNYP